ncbi:hypothetical protein MKW94_017867 [Papaver nudicaule]|uniref:J domain-containing protein n=1 Tax=Papaver nudicaule TaxID=74823 RepID=A0AA41RUX3_PAPNU|nr:hypothetical protein [Papaver nudicaule]
MEEEADFLRDDIEIKFKEQEFLRDDAEIKFKEQDFAGALWLANMAADMHPDFPGIQQYIAAYSIHVAAYESTIKHNNVRVPDWYRMLDIHDDLYDVDIDTIKKQYKRMALLVHPDKNSSAAAESAFKLLQDALELLSDPEKRQIYEIKRYHSREEPTKPPAAENKEKKREPTKPAAASTSASPSSKQRDGKVKKPSVKHRRSGVSKKERKINRIEADREGGHPSSYYEYVPEDAWTDDEEEEAGEEEMTSEIIRPCPTCIYPCYAKTCEEVAVLDCRRCDRKFTFCLKKTFFCS